MNRIAVICPYFGELPQNIDVTLASMAENKFITWFLLTDMGDKYVGKYANIDVIKCSFEKLKNLIESKIGTHIYAPYKLCDYKPTFGDLFCDYFVGYEFWGYYDLDVVYGNLSRFITEAKLDIYDKIYDLGHFSIYRNVPEVCLAYKGNDKVYVPFKEILNAKCICVFDETYDSLHKGINGILTHLGYRVYEKRDEFADISVVWKNFLPNGARGKRRDYYFEYNNGSVFMKRIFDRSYMREVAYVHLQKKKKIPILTNNFNHYYILPKGYTNINIKIYDYFYLYDMHWNWYFKFRINRKWSKVKELKGISIDIIYK